MRAARESLPPPHPPHQARGTKAPATATRSSCRANLPNERIGARLLKGRQQSDVGGSSVNFLSSRDIASGGGGGNIWPRDDPNRHRGGWLGLGDAVAAEWGAGSQAVRQADRHAHAAAAAAAAGPSRVSENLSLCLPRALFSSLTRLNSREPTLLCSSLSLARRAQTTSTTTAARESQQRSSKKIDLCSCNSG